MELRIIKVDIKMQCRPNVQHSLLMLTLLGQSTSCDYWAHGIISVHRSIFSILYFYYFCFLQFKCLRNCDSMYFDTKVIFIRDSSLFLNFAEWLKLGECIHWGYRGLASVAVWLTTTELWVKPLTIMSVAFTMCVAFSKKYFLPNNKLDAGLFAVSHIKINVLNFFY